MSEQVFLGMNCSCFLIVSPLGEGACFLMFLVLQFWRGLSPRGL